MQDHHCRGWADVSNLLAKESSTDEVCNFITSALLAFNMKNPPVCANSAIDIFDVACIRDMI